MKYVVLAALLLASCTQSETSKIELNEHPELDSILTKSQQNLKSWAEQIKKAIASLQGK